VSDCRRIIEGIVDDELGCEKMKRKERKKSDAGGLIGLVDQIILFRFLIFACALLYPIGLFGAGG